MLRKLLAIVRPAKLTNAHQEWGYSLLPLTRFGERRASDFASLNGVKVVNPPVAKVDVLAAVDYVRARSPSGGRNPVQRLLRLIARRRMTRELNPRHG